MSEPDDDNSLRVVVVGYGPVGRVVCQRLRESGATVTVVELNPQTVESITRLGRCIIEGDATDPQTLHRAGIEQAHALIVAIPDEDAAVRICHVARQLSSHLFIAVRTNFVSKGMMASEAGADHVVVEEIVTAEAMQQAVMRHLIEERNK